MSECFLSHFGVKQGEPWSPFLFVMFIKYMVANINHDLNDIVDVLELRLFLLLYADDSVIFAKSKKYLQAMLHDACFCYDQTVLDVVDSFNYLGITLFKNGGWY
jgi:hypothetical protein